MEIDPVCGMEVDPKTAEFKSIYHGKMYYFCSRGCKNDFEKDPEKYINPTAHDAGHEGHHMHPM